MHVAVWAMMCVHFDVMDKKIRKRIDALKQRLQQRRQQLASAKSQPDEPGEDERLEREIAAIETELEQLQNH